MLKDITIGQYFPGNSVIHRMDPRFKIVMTLLFIVMLFLGQHLYSGWCSVPWDGFAPGFPFASSGRVSGYCCRFC